jgi:hypothetical protein
MSVTMRTFISMLQGINLLLKLACTFGWITLVESSYRSKKDINDWNVMYYSTIKSWKPYFSCTANEGPVRIL